MGGGGGLAKKWAGRLLTGRVMTLTGTVTHRVVWNRTKCKSLIGVNRTNMQIEATRGWRLRGGGCSLAEIGFLAKVAGGLTHRHTRDLCVCVVSGVRQRLPLSCMSSGDVKQMRTRCERWAVWTGQQQKNEWSTSSSHAPKLTISEDFVSLLRHFVFKLRKYQAAAGYLKLST